ncbi:MAG: pitrilysin family protein [Flavobacteriaceae bacterium]|jgi:predicted Zn-dependent peptidase|nr:pitrilysin family protein [Flavobacteriaceae bacterium]MDG1942177.1 pitrilysin family protein [Flavobacteriaceae bacterium]
MMRALILFVCVGFLSNAQAQVDRSVQPQPGPAPEINFGTPKEHQFKSGLTLMVVENHKLPQVSVSLSIDNPLAVEGEKAGLSRLLSSMMGKGSKNIPKDDFDEEVDFMGARLGLSSQGGYASALKRYFPRVFEMMADAALHPHFLEEEFQKEVDKTLEGLKSSEKDVKTAARRVENLLSYGKDHPYGEYVSEESVKRVSIDDLHQLYQKNFYAQNAYITIVGDIDFKTAKKLTKKYFGKWAKGQVAPSSFTKPENVSQTQIAFVEMPNAVQSEVSVVSTANIDRNNPDYYALTIANQILGGGGEARLFLNLREDKGYTYGSYSRFDINHKTKSRIRAFAAVRNAVTDSAVVQLLYEIDRMSKEMVTEEELKLVKEKYAGSLIRSMEDPENIATFAYNTKTQNLPPNFYNNLLKNIQKVTREDISRVSKKYFDPSLMRVVVTGKGSDILTPLENIDFNGQKLKVLYFDKYGNPTERPEFSKPLPEGLTAKGVMDGYIKAIGGRAKLEGIKTKATISEASMQGMTIQVSNQQTAKNQMRVEVSMMGNVMQKMVINASKGYNEMQGQKMELKGKEFENALKDAALFPEMDIDPDQISLEGIVVVNGKDAYEIKWSDNKSHYYAVDDFLKIQTVETMEMQGQIQSSTTNFSNYKAVEGIHFPHTVQQDMGPQKVDFQVKSITLNKPMDDNLFE